MLDKKKIRLKHNFDNPCTIAQMAEWVAADSRVWGLNAAKDPMEGASISQRDTRQ